MARLGGFSPGQREGRLRAENQRLKATLQERDAQLQDVTARLQETTDRLDKVLPSVQYHRARTRTLNRRLCADQDALADRSPAAPVSAPGAGTAWANRSRGWLAPLASGLLLSLAVTTGVPADLLAAFVALFTPK
jgi:hypothetical protein